MRHLKGFTLIELVVVLAIIGILAAVAVPRFIVLTTEARAATVNGTAGAIRSAVSLAVAKYTAVANSAATTVDMNGTSVTVNAGTGIPTGAFAGIGNALGFTSATDANGLVVDYTTATAVTFRPATGGSATCQASYNGTTGVVTVTTTGC